MTRSRSDMARRGPVAQKDLKTYSVDEYPYMVAKKYGDPRYFRTFREARGMMLADLDSLKHALADVLGDQDAAREIAAARYLVEQMPDTGAVISHMVDPYTGVRYQAELVNRTKGLE